MPVYFLTAPGIPVIKIGYSKRPSDRRQNCSVWSPVPLTLAAEDPTADPFTEAELLDRFHPHLSHGEWFRAVPELVALVEETATTGRVPGAWRMPEPFLSRGINFYPRGPHFQEVEQAFGLSRSDIERIVGRKVTAFCGLPVAACVKVIRHLVAVGRIHSPDEFFVTPMRAAA